MHIVHCTTWYPFILLLSLSDIIARTAALHCLENARYDHGVVEMHCTLSTMRHSRLQLYCSEHFAMQSSYPGNLDAQWLCCISPPSPRPPGQNREHYLLSQALVLALPLVWFPTLSFQMSISAVWIYLCAWKLYQVNCQLANWCKTFLCFFFTATIFYSKA